ncbi:MAG TPA: right-handed parallel beta-helix repeat-containing protein [Pyrinomonadaceae bacterium]|nr:right-handed parallel beta-helix repeat-containing protein [Pyrinomonadaceae bacterium]
MKESNRGRTPRAAVLLPVMLAAVAAVACVYKLARAGPGLAAQQGGVYVSTRGSDSNDGSSPGSPLRTISESLRRARPGETVFVEGGTYHEQVVTRRAGREGARITISSFNGTAVLDGSLLPWRAGAEQNQGLVELRHPFVTLAGLRVVNSKNTGVLLDADDLTVENCEVAETRLHGISTHTDRQTNYPRRAGSMIRRVMLRGNVVARAALAGNSQAVSLIADGFLVSGNTVRDNATEGIDIWLGAKRGEVTGNTVHGNGAAGIYVDGASFVRIHRNLVYGNRSGVGVSSEDANYSTHHVWVYNNVVYDNREAGLFLWDDRARPGRWGAQAVVLAHNTLAGNRHSVYLAGGENSVEVVNNVGYSDNMNVYDESVKSSTVERNNIWLPSARGFVSASRKDFRLTSNSPAVDKGRPVPPFRDDRGITFNIGEDFDGRARVSGHAPDAGAFEYDLRG